MLPIGLYSYLYGAGFQNWKYPPREAVFPIAGTQASNIEKSVGLEVFDS